jgi:hypothetical protein
MRKVQNGNNIAMKLRLFTLLKDERLEPIAPASERSCVEVHHEVGSFCQGREMDASYKLGWCLHDSAALGSMEDQELYI